jgi:hypothetical protein
MSKVFLNNKGIDPEESVIGYRGKLIKVSELLESYHKEQLNLTNVSGMFSEKQMEEAWTDGCGCGESRSGYFDIENYR